MPKYEINVSLDGHHWCKIVLPEGTFHNEAVLKRAAIRKFFGSAFKVDMTAWTTVGRVVLED